MRLGCCWPLQIATADVRRHGEIGENAWLPCGWNQLEGSVGRRRLLGQAFQIHFVSHFNMWVWAVRVVRALNSWVMSGRQVRLLSLRSKRGSPSRLPSRKRSVSVHSRHLDMFCWIYATNCPSSAQKLSCSARWCCFDMSRTSGVFTSWDIFHFGSLRQNDVQDQPEPSFSHTSSLSGTTLSREPRQRASFGRCHSVRSNHGSSAKTTSEETREKHESGQIRPLRICRKHFDVTTWNLRTSLKKQILEQLVLRPSRFWQTVVSCVSVGCPWMSCWFWKETVRVLSKARAKMNLSTDLQSFIDLPSVVCFWISFSHSSSRYSRYKAFGCPEVWRRTISKHPLVDQPSLPTPDQPS